MKCNAILLLCISSHDLYRFRDRVTVWILWMLLLQKITRYHGGFNMTPTTIRTKAETTSADIIEYMRGSQLRIYCKIHIYRYYGRVYINPRTYVSEFGKRLEVCSYAPLPSSRSFVKFSDLFGAALLSSPQYPTRFVELISILDKLLIWVAISIKNFRAVLYVYWTLMWLT